MNWLILSLVLPTSVIDVIVVTGVSAMIVIFVVLSFIGVSCILRVDGYDRNAPLVLIFRWWVCSFFSSVFHSSWSMVFGIAFQT